MQQQGAEIDPLIQWEPANPSEQFNFQQWIIPNFTYWVTFTLYWKLRMKNSRPYNSLIKAKGEKAQLNSQHDLIKASPFFFFLFYGIKIIWFLQVNDHAMFQVIWSLKVDIPAMLKITSWKPSWEGEICSPWKVMHWHWCRERQIRMIAQRTLNFCCICKSKKKKEIKTRTNHQCIKYQLAKEFDNCYIRIELFYFERLSYQLTVS